MRRVIIALVVGLALIQGAWAQDSEQVLSGFKLGKFYSVCSLLAMELYMIQGMCADFDPARCTQENLDNGVITQDDMDTAVILETYAQIRADTLIRSICEQGLAEETFNHPALTPFKDRIVPLIDKLWQDTQTFIEGGDPVALGKYVEALAAGGYADSLIALAEEAATAAGDTEEATEIAGAGD